MLWSYLLQEGLPAMLRLYLGQTGVKGAGKMRMGIPENEFGACSGVLYLYFYLLVY